MNSYKFGKMDELMIHCSRHLFFFVMSHDSEMVSILVTNLCKCIIVKHCRRLCAKEEMIWFWDESIVFVKIVHPVIPRDTIAGPL